MTDIISITLAVAALGLSILGVVYSRKAIRQSAYRNTTDLALEYDRIFLEHPSLRPYFYENQDCPSGDRRHHVQAASEMLLDILEAIWDHRHQLPSEDLPAWQEWIHGVFETSPTMRTMYEDDTDWYPTLTDLFEGAACTKPDEHSWSAARS